MIKRFNYITALLCVLNSNLAHTDVIDPEAFIKKYGYTSTYLGDNGETTFYTASKLASTSQIKNYVSDVVNLPKHKDVISHCEFMRGVSKVQAIAHSKVAVDVALFNYGYSHSTIVCVLKFMYGNKISTNLTYSKAIKGSIYMLWVYTPAK